METSGYKRSARLSWFAQRNGRNSRNLKIYIPYGNSLNVLGYCGRRSDNRPSSELANGTGVGLVGCVMIGAMRPVEGGNEDCPADKQQECKDAQYFI
jgi:hypothetical protein